MHYLNYVKDFWFALVDNDPALVAKIDQQTVDELQLMAPRAEAKVVHGLMLSGQAFADFDQNERTAIWERLRSFSSLVPSLYSFFEDFKCFENWAHCLTRLFTLERHTVQITMKNLWTYSGDGDGTCLVQTSESAFSSRAEPPETRFHLAYRQIWLYVMRHYPQMPRDPKRKNRLAKPANTTADEHVVFDMCCLARRLGFQSDKIRDLSNHSPDRLIALHALLQARKPDLFMYDEITLDSLVDTITGCFTRARRKDAVATPAPLVVCRSVKRKARCGHPTVPALQQDRPLLFLDHLHAAEIPDRVTTFFMRRSVYLDFFGPRSTLPQGANGFLSPPSVSMSPLFISADSPSENHEYLSQVLQDDAHSPSRQRPREPPGPPSADTNEREGLRRGTAAGLTAELRRSGEAETAQSTAAQLAMEQELNRHEVEQRARERHETENICLQARADEMTRRIQEAEERTAQQAAELERLRREAAERAARDIVEVLPSEDQVLDDTMDYTPKGDVVQTAPRNTQQAERRAARGQAATPAQLQSMAENCSLPPETENFQAEPSRPPTQIDVLGVIARCRDRRSRFGRKEARLFHNPYNNSIRQQQRRRQRVKRTRIKEPRASRLVLQDANQDNQDNQDENQEGGRVASNYDHLGWAYSRQGAETIRRANGSEAQPAAQAAELERPSEETIEGVAQTEQALPAGEKRVDQEKQMSENTEIITDDVDSDLIEMLQSDAENRALGEQFSDNRAQLEVEPSATARDTQQESIA